jgi:hypothetical protein
MLKTIFTSLLPRLLQDLLVSAAALLTAHGYLDASDQQKFIGAAFFLSMLIINYVQHLKHGSNAATAGAEAVGGTITSLQASNIAKGKTP